MVHIYKFHVDLKKYQENKTSINIVSNSNGFNVLRVASAALIQYYEIKEFTLIK